MKSYALHKYHSYSLERLICNFLWGTNALAYCLFRPDRLYKVGPCSRVCPSNCERSIFECSISLMPLPRLALSHFLTPSLSLSHSLSLSFLMNTFLHFWLVTLRHNRLFFLYVHFLFSKKTHFFQSLSSHFTSRYYRDNLRYHFNQNMPLKRLYSTELKTL